mmetsp:Transcript_9142/g.31769  ORF Transcript_9142/g.31769 Transcript_9142/m.31769 type:complete len:203 (+) Transcript_9142:523-1131(+)
MSDRMVRKLKTMTSCAPVGLGMEKSLLSGSGSGSANGLRPAPGAAAKGLEPPDADGGVAAKGLAPPAGGGVAAKGLAAAPPGGAAAGAAGAAGAPNLLRAAASVGLKLGANGSSVPWMAGRAAAPLARATLSRPGPDESSPKSAGRGLGRNGLAGLGMYFSCSVRSRPFASPSAAAACSASFANLLPPAGGGAGGLSAGPSS